MVNVWSNTLFTNFSTKLKKKLGIPSIRNKMGLKKTCFRWRRREPFSKRVEEELYGTDIDGIGNLEDYLPRLVFIDEE